MTSLLRTAGLALLLTVSGCALGPHRDQLATFTLQPLTAQSQPDSLAVARWQLLIDEPIADPLLAGERIVRSAPDGLGVYRGVAWSEGAPQLLQRLLVQSFQNSGRIPAVARSTANLRGDLLLVTELRAFNTEADQSVHIAIQAQLLHSGSQKLVATRLFEEAEPLQPGGAAAIVRGFQTALDRLLPKLLEWTLERGEAAAAQDLLDAVKH